MHRVGAMVHHGMLRNEIIVLIYLDAHRSLFAYESSGPKFMFDLDTNFDFAYGGQQKKPGQRSNQRRFESAHFRWKPGQSPTSGPAEIGSTLRKIVPACAEMVFPLGKISPRSHGNRFSPRKNRPRSSCDGVNSVNGEVKFLP